MRLMQKAVVVVGQALRGVRRRLRRYFYRFVLGAVGARCQIADDVLLVDAQNIYLGNEVVINEGVVLQSCEGAGIRIGDRAVISYGAMVITGGLDLTGGINYDKHVASPVRIHDEAWIGARAIILPGVTVGRGAVVAAGSLVKDHVDAGTLVAGVPARRIRTLVSAGEAGPRPSR